MHLDDGRVQFYGLDLEAHDLLPLQLFKDATQYAVLGPAVHASAEGHPAALRGHSLLPLIHSQAGARLEFAFSESDSTGNITGSFMIRKGDWKYIYFTGDKPLLFNSKADPSELRDLAEEPELAGLVHELQQHLTSLVYPDAVTYRAFDKQHQILMNMVHSLDAESFYKRLLLRMGPAQPRILTYKLYKEKAARKGLSRTPVCT